MPKRNLSLDGIRGTAVILILLYHHSLLNSGWLGVDLFFVLSGYLITNVLRRTCSDEGYWREFWIKRATRILPPLLVLLVTVELLYRLPAIWVGGCLVSFGDVFAYLKSTFEPTRPLWSLAVEEHFYFFWPFAVRYMPRRKLMTLLVAIILLEPISRGLFTYLYRPDWSTFYFLTPFRLDAIGLGSLLSLLLENKSAWLERYAGWATVATCALYGLTRTLAGVSFTRDGNSPLYNGAAYFLVAITAFFLIAHLLLRPTTMLAKLFSWRPLVWFGNISYGLYLYQLTIRDLLMRVYGLPPHRIFWLSATVSTVAAWLSFRFMEEPMILWGKQLADSFRTTPVPVQVQTAP